MRYRNGCIVFGLLVLSVCRPKPIEKVAVDLEAVRAALALERQGDLLSNDQKDHLALLKFVEASNLNPNSERVFNKLGVTYSRLDMLRQSRRAIERALQLSPNYYQAHNALGVVQLKEGRPRRAIKSFKKALSISPEVAGVYLNLGSAYFEDGKYEQAKLSYKKALQLDPTIVNRRPISLTVKKSEEQGPEWYYQKAILHATIGDRSNCLNFMEKALDFGLVNKRRIQREAAFEGMLQDDDFRRLLANYGIIPN